MSNTERNLRAVNLPAEWRPDSWRARPGLQMPVYPDAAELAAVQAELQALPPAFRRLILDYFERLNRPQPPQQEPPAG